MGTLIDSRDIITIPKYKEKDTSFLNGVGFVSANPTLNLFPCHFHSQFFVSPLVADGPVLGSQVLQVVRGSPKQDQPSNAQHGAHH